MNSQKLEMLRSARRHFGRGLLFAAFVSCFTNLLHLTVPLYMMQVYDRVMTSRSMETLTMLTVVALGALVVYGLLDYIRARTYLIIGDNLARRLNLPTLQAAIADTLKSQSSNASQAIRDLNDLRMFASSNAISVPLELIWTPLFLAILFLFHPVYGILAIGSAAILFGFSLVTDFITRSPLSEANSAASRSFSEIAVTVRHAEAIEAMGMLPALARMWQQSQRSMLDLMHRGSNAGRAMASASKAVRMGVQIASLCAGVILVIDHEISPGTMLATNIIMARMLSPFEHLIDSWRQWIFAYSAYKRVHALLTEKAPQRQEMSLPRPEGILTVDRLVYLPPGADKPVLRGVSFALEPGEVLGVIGPSAAGKSTLARMLVGLWEPTSGGVYLDGHSTFSWEREDFGRYVGYVPQSISLLEGTIRQNISRMNEADPRDVVAAARRAGVHEMIGRLPNGYDTRIGDTGYALSGGQRQRIALARALFGDPRLIVLDEPNSNLDAMGEQALLQTITEARKSGITVVLIAHRPSLMTVVDKILVLKDGMVEQFGPKTDIIKTVTPGRPAAQSRSGTVTQIKQVEEQ